MKSLLSLAFFLAAATAFAGPYPIMPLAPGSSAILYDYNSSQYVQVTCERGMPVPPPAPPTSSVCTLKYNPVADSCSAYRVYRDGQQESDCMASFSDAIAKLHEFYRNAVCRPAPAVSCDMKFNPPADSCSAYRIYAGSQQISDCMSSSESAEQMLTQLRGVGICR